MATPTTTTEHETEAIVQAEAAPTGLAALGVNPPLLAAQVVNFLLLLVILRLVLYRPLLAMLRRRRETIEAGVKAAQESQARASAVEQETAAVLAAARTEAKSIVGEAKAQAETIAAEIRTVAGQEAEALLARTRTQLTQEKTAIVAQAEQELGALVVRATERVIGRQQLAIKTEDVARALAEAKEQR